AGNTLAGSTVLISLGSGQVNLVVFIKIFLCTDNSISHKSKNFTPFLAFLESANPNHTTGLWVIYLRAALAIAFIPIEWKLQHFVFVPGCIGTDFPFKI